MTTIYDVAKAAGVSPKTVSRVLNGDGPVNEKTRAVVANAIAHLHYVPSRAARMMRLQRSGLIGMITGAISTAFEMSEPAGLPEILILQGAQRLFARRGKILMITDTGGDAERVPQLLQTLLEHRVEGLLCVAGYHRQIRLPTDVLARPVVLVNCFDDAGTPAVVPDDAAGQHAAVGGLVARGHRRIGFLTPPKGSVAARRRIEGYRKALDENGIPFDEDIVIAGVGNDGAINDRGLGDALDRLLGLPEPPSAICCGNDQMAMRVYAMLRSRGVAIAGNISVVGYDDYRLISEHLDPTLSSVELPYPAMGERAAERLLDLIDMGGKFGTGDAIERIAGPVTWRNSVRNWRCNVA